MTTDPLDSTTKKKVDESWKDSVTKEKVAASDPSPQPQQEPLQDTGLTFFISTLGMQALSALGELPDPMARSTSINLDHAKYIIDIIQMLSEKTRGNVTPEEAAAFENLLYELRMKFVQKTQELTGDR